MSHLLCPNLQMSSVGACIFSIVVTQNQAILEAISFFQDQGESKGLYRMIDQHDPGGILALFHGPPGTGKTYSAQAIAFELDKPLAMVRYYQLINKWYGQSEKNMAQCFNDAKEKDYVLLFDEADAMINARGIGRRTAADETEHRLRNIFLQEIEGFPGTVILTTNLIESLDPALERRLNLRLEFHLPDARARELLWKKILKKAPLSPEINISALAQNYKLSGGHIKNATLNSLRKFAYLRKTTPKALITQKILEQSARRELDSVWTETKNKIVGFST